MSEFTVREENGRVLIVGPVPLSLAGPLLTTYGEQGMDAMVPGVAYALGATFALCRDDDVDAWRAETDELIAKKYPGDKFKAWWHGTDSGTSSQTIMAVLGPKMETYRPPHGSYPSDPDDFGRCHRLLERFPEFRPRLHEVADRYPAWKGLVQAWDSITKLYLEELPSGRAPKTYDLMKACIRGSEASA